MTKPKLPFEVVPLSEQPLLAWVKASPKRYYAYLGHRMRRLRTAVSEVGPLRIEVLGYDGDWIVGDVLGERLDEPLLKFVHLSDAQVSAEKLAEKLLLQATAFLHVRWRTSAAW